MRKSYAPFQERVGLLRQLGRTQANDPETISGQNKLTDD